MNYLVRQYRPNYVTGFENAVYKDVPRDKITSVPFMKNFEHHGFVKFKVEVYTKGEDELIISAQYADGKSWVAGFALPMDSNDMSNNGDLMRNNWRYANAVPFDAPPPGGGE